MVIVVVLSSVLVIVVPLLFFPKPPSLPLLLLKLLPSEVVSAAKAVSPLAQDRCLGLATSRAHFRMSAARGDGWSTWGP